MQNGIPLASISSKCSILTRLLSFMLLDLLMAKIVVIKGVKSWCSGLKAAAINVHLSHSALPFPLPPSSSSPRSSHVRSPPSS
ncbi:hypothetical protein FEM48_Zijuj01G0280800 [Ziziphus jujuba var. spinosa]|uniref:Uncharacterized protein n=1 Tax=Ziziphus jujuba var. spinosa TaxID=714518 RepID=A0A978W5D4_ZIZJJ|nr:hypothetical protein FEM48_Zijuj01G0280800 [Ziziphus jujuba var. spinosa]